MHLPEEYGGGGGGMTELAIVCEELAAQGCPLLLILVSPAICAELHHPLRHATQQKERWLRPMATGDEDGVRDHRARRRLEQPQPLDHRDARR